MARVAGCWVLLAGRHAAYFTGMVWGIVSAPFRSGIRWVPMRAKLQRRAGGGADTRVLETVSCKIGSLAKEAPSDA